MGRDLRGGPTSGQLLDPPLFSVSIFPLTLRGVQKKTNQKQKKARIGTILQAVSSHTLKEAFPLHTQCRGERC